MSKDFDYIVLGGGFAGWSVIDHLLQLGCAPEQMTLVESRLSATGASSVPWALMHPVPGRSLYPRPGYLEAWLYSLQYLDQCQGQSNQQLFRSLPLWRLAYDPTTAQRFEKSFQRALASEFKQLYPLQKRETFDLNTLKVPLTQYSLEQGRVVFLPELVSAIQSQSRIQTYQYIGKTRFERCDTGWKLHFQDQELRCRHLVLATGTGVTDLTNSVFKETKIKLEVSHGELVLFRSAQNLPAAVSAAGQFVVPLGEDLFYTGATHYQTDRQIPPEQSWNQLQTSLSWFKSIQNAQWLRIWHGQRINATDREPLVGQIQPGLWLMAGFSTRGTLLIPIAARILSQKLQGLEQVIPNWMDCHRYTTLKH